MCHLMVPPGINVLFGYNQSGLQVDLGLGVDLGGRGVDLGLEWWLKHIFEVFGDSYFNTFVMKVIFYYLVNALSCKLFNSK